MLIRNKSLILLLVLSSVIQIHSQTFIQAYADISNQCKQSNITSNLTEFESLGLKRRGSTALQNTFDWLKNKFLNYGYTASQIKEDSYTYQGSISSCKNLIVTKTGTLYPNTFVIMCGHYDSIGGTGTNDNGSGIACILETARLLQNIPTEYSIKFICFSGEEDGLYGSQHYVSSIVNGTNPKMDLRLVFNLDEVGGVVGKVNNTITCERDTNNSPSTNNAASSTFTNELITCVGLYSPLSTYLSYAYSSDYMPFQSNNEIITGFFETNETTHKHTNTDLLIYMDPVYNFNVAKAAIGAMLHFTRANTTLSSNEFENPFQVRIWTNETQRILHIDMGLLQQSNCKLSLLDFNGRTVFSNLIPEAKSFEQIDLNTFQNGLYLVVVESKNQRITKKFILQ